MNRLEWLRERQTGIGASDTPNLVGVGFGDAMSVYRSKVEPVRDAEPEGYLELGLYLEPLIGKKYSEMMGCRVEPLSYRIMRHCDAPWLFASPDFQRPDGRYMQAKTVAGFGDEWGPSGTDQIPDGYRVQVLQEMACTDTDSIDVAALCRITGELRVYRVMWEMVEFHLMYAVAYDFWHGHVEPRKPPTAEWEQRFADARLPFTRDKAVELPEELAPLLDQRAALSAIEKEASGEVDRLNAEIMRALGDGHKATCGGWKISRIRTDDEIKPAELVPERIVKGKDYLRITAAKGKR